MFIALPDGNALYYTFMGTAGEPKLASAVAREWPCKREHIETFVVNNWLKTAQRQVALIPRIAGTEYVVLRVYYRILG